MDNKSLNKILFEVIFIVLAMGFASAVMVDGEYATFYPGEEGRVSVQVENNGDFDIEGVSISLDLREIPFSSIGSSFREVDNLDEGDDDSVSFRIRPSTEIAPGDYELTYTLKYSEAGNDTNIFEERGNFGVRVSARTDLDFSGETIGDAIVGYEGSISLEIINKGLGEIKSASVQIFPRGFELLSKSKVFVGSVDAEDSDTATFDVLYNDESPVLSALVTYKNFENEDQKEMVEIPLNVYSKERALELGLISESNVPLYLGIAVAIIIALYIRRKIKKRRRRKELNGR